MCPCVRTYIYMYVLINIVHICINMHMYIYVYIQCTYGHILYMYYVHVCMLTYKCMHIHTGKYFDKYTNIHEYICTFYK